MEQELFKSLTYLKVEGSSVLLLISCPDIQGQRVRVVDKGVSLTLILFTLFIYSIFLTSHPLFA